MLRPPRLVAAFYLVSAETPPYRAPALAHPSQVISIVPFVAAFYMVSAETTPYTAPGLAHSSPTWDRYTTPRGGLLRGVC